MNKKIKNLIMLPVMLLVGMIMITNVKADGFNVTRSITGVTNTAVNTFTYTVVANNSTNPATVTPPNAATITFGSSDAVSSNTLTKTSSPLIAESVWTGLSYSQPGTYTFNVTETSSNNTVYPADTSTWVVTVYVTNEMNNGVPTGNLQKAYIGAVKSGTTNKIGKDSNVTFTSAASMSNISVTNSVKGALANTNEFFKYTVTITNSVSGANYVISTPNSGSITYNGSTVTQATSCTGTCVVYLKHNQTATIGVSGSYKQVPVGVTYSVAQNNTTSQTTLYTTTTYKVGSGSATSGTSTGNKTISATASNNAVTFENTAGDGDTPTGVLIKLFPFLVLLVLSGIGLYTVNKNKKLELSE